MKLERSEEMMNEISETWDALITKRIAVVVKYYENNRDIYHNKIVDILRGLADSRQGYLVISYLRSSAVTESHEFYFAYYADEPFIEEEPDGVILEFGEFFHGLEEDISELKNCLSKKFIRIFSSELEEIRRSYTLCIYAECEKLFCWVLDNVSEQIGIDVWYGEYMGETVNKIGTI